MYFDYSYIYLILPAIIISLVAQISVKRNYSKMSAVYSKSGYSGAQAALAVLRYYGITDVRVEQCSGKLSDHYDPRSKVIGLSEGVYSSTSIAAIGIACHEAGHAIQHATGYEPLKMRSSLVPALNFASPMSYIFFVIGILFNFTSLVYIGIICFALCFVFALVTLPVEFNASKRAIHLLNSTGTLSTAECDGVEKVLGAAAFTYVAAFVVSLLNLLRFIILFRDRD